MNAAAYAVGERAQGYEEGFLYMIGHIAVAYAQHGQDLPVIPVDEGNESVGYYQSFSERWRMDPRGRDAASKRIYADDQPLVEAVCLDAQPDTDLAEPFSTGMYDAYLICAEAAHLRQANNRLLEQTGS
ncbi:MAG TPA: hypothetical protein VKX46_01510 [Ktedonobacteraceae bacterium]|nr:hypothetical protein [Ktedonobacteraceae bacterium]